VNMVWFKLTNFTRNSEFEIYIEDRDANVKFSFFAWQRGW
jgi:hypothetical protein